MQRHWKIRYIDGDRGISSRQCKSNLGLYKTYKQCCPSCCRWPCTWRGWSPSPQLSQGQWRTKQKQRTLWRQLWVGKKEKGCKPDCKIFEPDYNLYPFIRINIFSRTIRPLNIFVILTSINGNWRNMSMTTSPDLTHQIVHEDLFATQPLDEKRRLH